MIFEKSPSLATPVVGGGSSLTAAAMILPIDAIQEFNLEENPKAEYGWKPVRAILRRDGRAGQERQRVKVHVFPAKQTYAGMGLVCFLLATLVIQGCNKSDVSADAPAGKKGKGRGGDGGPAPGVGAKVKM